MRRRLTVVAPSILILLLVAATASAQQADRVFYSDRVKKKEPSEQLRIKEETPKEIIIERGVRTEKLSVADVRDIDYRIPADLNLEVRSKARREEELALKETDPVRRRKANETALSGYRDLVTKLGKLEGYERARRHAEFKTAVILTRLAEDDPAELDEAIKTLAQFKTDHDKSWQVGMVGKLLAQAQIAKGDLKGALATYEEFAHRDDLPPQVHQEYDLLGSRALLQTENFAEAERRLSALAKTLAKDDPQAVRVEIYLAACRAKTNLPDAEKRLQSIIRSDAAIALKALAYNTLGDCYRVNNRLEDAFWQYLWVDQEYPQDNEEHAKALYFLSILFEKAKKMPGRAQSCRDRLLNDKSFAGLEYQRRAARESRKLVDK